MRAVCGSFFVCGLWSPLPSPQVFLLHRTAPSSPFSLPLVFLPLPASFLLPSFWFLVFSFTPSPIPTRIHKGFSVHREPSAHPKEVESSLDHAGRPNREGKESF